MFSIHPGRGQHWGPMEQLGWTPGFSPHTLPRPRLCFVSHQGNISSFACKVPCFSATTQALDTIFITPGPLPGFLAAHRLPTSAHWPQPSSHTRLPTTQNPWQPLPSSGLCEGALPCPSPDSSPSPHHELQTGLSVPGDHMSPQASPLPL